jgi:type II pantothenate kinase
LNLISIDVGTSTTKIIETNENDEILNKMILNEKNIIKAFDTFVNKNDINISNIEKIITTGINSKKIHSINKIKIFNVDEFIAIGYGGKFLSKKKDVIVASVGTGTAFVKANGDNIVHIGGSRSWRRYFFKFK